MQRWQCPIYNGTLETFYWLKMAVSSLRLILQTRNASHYIAEKPQMKLVQFKATQALISNSYLISLKGYCCKSGIAIFARRITRKFAYSLINKIFSSTCKQCVVQQGEPNLRCANFSGESNNLINWQIHFAT